MNKFFFIAISLLTILYLEYKTAFVESYISGKWNVDEGEVSLTFDDCPMEPYTSEILDILLNNDIKATFFITGKRALKHPDVLRRIVSDGHSIGNHGFSTRTPDIFNGKNTAEGIKETQSIVEDITGFRPQILRLPSGIPGRDIRILAEEENMELIFADVFILNERKESPEFLVEKIKENAESGSIVLLHGDHGAAVRALPYIINDLKNRNFKFVKIEKE